MKSLKEKMNKLDEKYVSMECLSEAEKKSTYGGALASRKDGDVVICYGVPNPKDGGVLA